MPHGTAKKKKKKSTVYIQLSDPFSTFSTGIVLQSFFVFLDPETVKVLKSTEATYFIECGSNVVCLRSPHNEIQVTAGIPQARWCPSLYLLSGG